MKKNKKLKQILAKILLIVYTLSDILLIINIIKLNNIENILRIIIILILLIVNTLLLFINIKKKKNIIPITVMEVNMVMAMTRIMKMRRKGM